MSDFTGILQRGAPVASFLQNSHLVKGTRRTKILATRCISWAPNKPELHFEPWLYPGSHLGSFTWVFP